MKITSLSLIVNIFIFYQKVQDKDKITLLLNVFFNIQRQIRKLMIDVITVSRYHLEDHKNENRVATDLFCTGVIGHPGHVLKLGTEIPN